MWFQTTEDADGCTKTVEAAVPMLKLPQLMNARSDVFMVSCEPWVLNEALPKATDGFCGSVCAPTGVGIAKCTAGGAACTPAPRKSRSATIKQALTGFRSAIIRTFLSNSC